MSDWLVELSLNAGAGWRTAGLIDTSTAPGSISSDDPDGRQVYLFGLWNGTWGVWRSKGGVDVEFGRTVRAVTPVGGIELLADLERVGVHEIGITKNGQPLTARFTLVPRSSSR